MMPTVDTTVEALTPVPPGCKWRKTKLSSHCAAALAARRA
jgi:hypothetical protein